jgi:hypothetical protein
VCIRQFHQRRFLVRFLAVGGGVIDLTSIRELNIPYKNIVNDEKNAPHRFIIGVRDGRVLYTYRPRRFRTQAGVVKRALGRPGSIWSPTPPVPSS